MTVMNMGNFVRIAYWITMLSHLLEATSPPIVDSNILYMEQHVNCPSDSRFYTPKNVKSKCITTALDCYMRELNGTVKVECDDPKRYIEDSVEYFSLIIKESKKIHPVSTSRECACETWPETDYRNFLREMDVLLKRHNAEKSQGKKKRHAPRRQLQSRHMCRG